MFCKAVESLTRLATDFAIPTLGHCISVTCPSSRAGQAALRDIASLTCSIANLCASTCLAGFYNTEVGRALSGSLLVGLLLLPRRALRRGVWRILETSLIIACVRSLPPSSSFLLRFVCDVEIPVPAFEAGLAAPAPCHQFAHT